MRYLLDTNVLSELVKRVPEPKVVAWIRNQSPLDLAISVLTIGELVKGTEALAAGQRRAELERWIASELPRQFVGRVLEIDAAIARAWGELTVEGKGIGRELPVIDGLLLATARLHELTFVTRNEGDCTGRGVAVFNPWD